jgi:hypothetical protein
MPVVRWFLLLCVLTRLHADDIALISVSEHWRYFKGASEPETNNTLLWFQSGYEDSQWPLARAGFSSAGGYGEVTVLTDYGATYHTVYFRKKFSITNLANISELVLRLDYDDAFVAYLNGQEVGRRGAPGTPNVPVPVNTLATNNHLRGSGELIDFTAAIPQLVPGENLLAVQILAATNSTFTMSFVPELLANITRGPYVQNTTDNSAQVIWNTLSAVPSSIEYGTNTTSVTRMDVSVASTNHVATITNLLSGAEYFYRVINRFSANETGTDWRSFRTFKKEGAVTFNVVGDSGWGSNPQLVIAERMRESPADFLMHVGDLVYYAITRMNADLRMFSIYRDEMRSRPWFLAVGNHEAYVEPEAALQVFYLPTNSVTGTEHYYSFDHGDVHFASVWSDLAAGSRYEPGSAQYAWLDADLAASDKPWKFLFFHHTWRTSSAHRVDDYDRNTVPDSLQMDQSLAKLAREHGVQIIFNGHDHCYERLAPSGGPISFISGGGGALPYPLTLPHPDSIQFYSAYHFLRVKVQDDVASVEAVGLDGNIFDRVHVRRDFPERALQHSSWNSPTVETGAPNDLDGNFFGQAFNFIGEPIFGPMGLFTSAGRLFVNNDFHQLYLGFDQVMLRAGEELFLFLEMPTLVGRSNLANLGNGLIDPDDEGADGLDFLSNLAFENFSPSVGVILGDEYGDYPSRGFLRAGQQLSTGQGAFHLVEGLPPVADQRLTQFNRSPQISAVSHEQNTDFVKIAIPFSSLGGVKPGDLIRVGAVTALPFINTNSAIQSRSIDSGGIGHSVRREEGTTLLEGILVELAVPPFADADGDGLSDSDEQARGTNPNNADSDADGLPDGWEVWQRLNPLSASAMLDTDQDGANNLMEYRAGTDPNNSNSRLALQIRSEVGQRLGISWSAVPGKRYRLQYRDNFTEAFRDLIGDGLPRVAQSSLESHWIDFDLHPRTGYYRVLLAD